MTEIWKAIPGYEGLYEVSDHGRIKRLARVSIVRGRWGSSFRSLPELIFSPGVNSAGYLHVTLRRESEDSTYLVHRIVALVFIPNPAGLETVNHKNGVKADNRIANLEWMDQGSNNRHARTALPFKQFRHGVRATDANGGTLEFPSKIAAEKELCGKATGLISWAIKNGRPALGMRWEVICA